MFDKFPWTNVHELNLDWILKILNKLKGGTKDQVLTRLSNKPLDFGWKTMSGGGGGGGTTNYNDLGNKPSINGVTLEGNKTSTQLNIPVGPELANTMPLMDGTPQIGSSSRAAKADHVHPSDSSKPSMAAVQAEIHRELQLYDPAEADYNPPYAEGTLGNAIKNAAIDPEDIQDAVDAYLHDHPAITGTFTNAAKNALLALLNQVAYANGNGQTYWDALSDELFAVAVSSITAVFTQGDATVWSDDPLDSLKSKLVVTAEYSDGTTATVAEALYELSGTLDSAVSTITVSYSGATTTFTANVTLVGNTEYAVSPNMSNIKMVGSPTTIRGVSNGVLWQDCSSSTQVSNWSNWAADSKTTLWSALENKTVRVRVSCRAPSWDDNGYFAIRFAVFAGPNITSLGNTGRLYTWDLAPNANITPDQDFTTHEWVLTLDLDDASAQGGGVPSASATAGLILWSISLNRVETEWISVKEILPE